MKAFGFDKVQGNITLSNHQWAGIMFLADNKMWSAQPANVQALFKETAIETQNWERKELNAVEAKYLKEMEDGGMVVTRLTQSRAPPSRKRWSRSGLSIGARSVRIWSRRPSPRNKTPGQTPQ